jgi:hypothetical protein
MANLFDPSSIYELLAKYGAVPQMSGRSPYSSASGEYETDTNRIVAPDPSLMRNPERAVSTLSHEMSHAAQHQLFFDAASRIQTKIRNKEKVSNEEKRFLENARKMYGSSFSTIGHSDRKKDKESRENLDAAIAKMYKPSGASGKMSNWDFYRTSPIELQAFGVGRMTKGGKQQQEAINPSDNPHLDPSFATEFAILMEQFKGLPEDVKTRPQKRDDFLRGQREAQDKKPTYQFVDITADPFKSSIK